MKNREMRLLEPSEIECRVGSIGEKGLSLLLYKNSRVDMKILDETYGTFGWQRTHQCIDGNLYCTVQVWDEEKRQWISKQDVGAAGFAEKEKSQASDSFKRACVSIGIGRELYSAPFIWIPADKCKIGMKDGKYIVKDKFTVHSISYNENREIAGLSIRNKEGEIVYSMDKPAVGQGKDRSAASSKNRASAMNKELERTGVALDTVLEHYQVSSLEEMTQDIFDQAMKKLGKTGTKAA